jgi:RND family efflux transporter MFP subunit
MRRYIIPAIIVLLAVAGLVWLVIALVGQPATTPPTAYTVRTGAISASVRATGRVEASRSLQLAFRSGEVVRKIYVKPGDFVPAGTLLAEQDSTNLARNLARAEGERDIARYQQSAANERAANQPTPTPAANPTPSFPTVFSDGYAAARQAELAELNLNAARQALENSRLYAPFDGTVITVNAQEGEFLNGPLMVFADLKGMQIRADIDELDVPNVELGQPVTITLDAFPGRTFDGRVATLAPSSTQRQGSTVYLAIVTFNKTPEARLRPGMASTLAITSLSKTGILVVPARAIETIGLRRFVTLLKPDGSTEKVPVEVGLSNGNETEIISGLTAGDRINIPR